MATKPPTSLSMTFPIFGAPKNTKDTAPGSAASG